MSDDVESLKKQLAETKAELRRTRYVYTRLVNGLNAQLSLPKRLVGYQLLEAVAEALGERRRKKSKGQAT